MSECVRMIPPRGTLVELAHGDAYGGRRLKCPYCTDTMTHHNEVHVYNRCEDDRKGMHTYVPTYPDRRAVSDGNMAGNPSSRRSGIRIVIDCECCGRQSALCIVQHKGTTYLRWDPVGCPEALKRLSKQKEAENAQRQIESMDDPPEFDTDDEVEEERMMLLCAI